MSDNALLTRLRPMSRDSSERAAICEVLVERYAHLVRACVRPYRGSPEPAEDLMQLGYVGLLKAINGFDPRVGDSLSAYAAPCVSGEADVLGEDDHAVEHALDMQAVHTHLGDLPEREQRALNLRFYGNLTQAEIGQRLGVSQMHVSRLLARSLALSPRSAEQRARQ